MRKQDMLPPGHLNPAAFTPRVTEPHTDAELLEAFGYVSSAYHTACDEEHRLIQCEFADRIFDEWLAKLPGDDLADLRQLRDREWYPWLT